MDKSIKQILDGPRSVDFAKALLSGSLWDVKCQAVIGLLKLKVALFVPVTIKECVNMATLLQLEYVIVEMNMFGTQQVTLKLDIFLNVLNVLLY